MIHAIYLKNKPKAKWNLVHITPSQALADLDREDILKEAINKGYELAEVSIKIFMENMPHIPLTLNEVKHETPLYN